MSFSLPTLEELQKGWEEYRRNTVRREITSHVDASVAMKRLRLTYPMWIYDADLDGSWGTTFPLGEDRHCVLVDLEALQDTVNEVAQYPHVRFLDPMVKEQLPLSVPFTFENFLRADIAHELSHLREDSEVLEHELNAQPFEYKNLRTEVTARMCGRELYKYIKISDVKSLQP